MSLLGDCVIYVNTTAVDPNSTHLFALLLVFCLESERRVNRFELHRLLFASDIGMQQASHNLRQLLYRVRRLGVVLDETPLGIRLPPSTTLSVTDQLSLLTTGECEGINAGSIAFLPSYSPRLPQQYLEWLNEARDSADHLIRTVLRNTATKLSESHAWSAAYRVSSTLAAIDPLNEDAVAVMAESLTMMGRRQEALSLIASFGGSDIGVPSVERLRPLRARIASLGEQRHQGTLRGRNECLAMLEAEWQKLGTDGARRAALIGSAGIGKSRVAEAFAARVKLLGGHVIRYTCDAASSEQPLGLFSDILPELRGLRGSIGASPELASALDRLRPVVVPEATLTSSDISVEAVRAQVQRALIDLLEAVSEEKRLLLLIDDAHYLDVVSSTVIRTLCTRSNTARLLILLCIRRSRADIPLVALAHRGLSFLIDPLPPEISKQVILDVAGPQTPTSHIEWCLAQAAGNPFYLHTLASQRFVDTTIVPFDIRSLASNAYSSLAGSTRSVLESCLLLGRLATLVRVGTISGVSETELLAALRELETLDLLQFSGSVLIGPHALLHDALIGLIPTSVAALLHRRIATSLEDECVAAEYVFPVAWAAAQSWLAAGEPHAAARLVRKCARQAALIGETAVATELLSRVVRATLPVGLHAELLDELIGYAEASASPPILASASRTRLKLAKLLGDNEQELREFERRIIEADLVTGQGSAAALEPLLRFLVDESTAPLTRAHAATRLLVISDEELDASLAERVYSYLVTLPRESLRVQTACVRAEVVFHTFCGDTTVARNLSLDLLNRFRQPASTQESIRARAFAAFALQRLRDERAADVFAETYEWMMSHGIFKEALYSASVRTTIALGLGDFDSAADWILKSKSALRGEIAHELSPQSGLYCDEAFLAMHRGQYDEAERLILAPVKGYSVPDTARYRAVSLALWIRLRQLRGDEISHLEELNQLEELYGRGKSLGGQDLVVEALWSARILEGNSLGASELLSDYLRSRREKVKPEWSLWHTTSADDAWIRD